MPGLLSDSNSPRLAGETTDTKSAWPGSARPEKNERMGLETMVWG
jgi:hypothetical protein